ncbi:MAG TPA: F0F1 ATP synthase subunit epsilon [Cyanobacteria bacterium UBA11372]|nr:F0F1 ATP synthase subunit epsilon [Cyanobacteria bacterium UBA11372]
MKLKVLLPTKILLEEEVSKITAEAANGSFCLLPRHIDFVTALVPGILIFVSVRGEEKFLAVDEGILVKSSAEVLVSTRHAVQSSDLGLLQETVEKQFRVLNEREKVTRSALAKLEVNIVRQFLELGKGGLGF